MQTERLTRLVRILREDAANPTGVQFDLSAWARDTERGAYNYRPDEQVKVNCGTQACAFGLAAISGEFKADGLDYRIDRNGALQVRYYDSEGFYAAALFFNISQADSEYLFDPSSYTDENGVQFTPEGAEGELFVAQRIEDFTKGIIDED